MKTFLEIIKANLAIIILLLLLNSLLSGCSHKNTLPNNDDHAKKDQTATPSSPDRIQTKILEEFSEVQEMVIFTKYLSTDDAKGAEQVFKEFQNPIPDSSTRLNRENRYYWFAFSLINYSHDPDWLLNIRDTKAKLFESIKNDSSDLKPILPNKYNNKSEKISGVIFDLTMKYSQKVTYLLKLNYDPLYSIKELTLSKKNVVLRHNNNQLIYGLILGLVIIIFFVLLFFFVRSFSPVYLFFGIYFLIKSINLIIPGYLPFGSIVLNNIILILVPIILRYLIIPLILHQNFKNSKVLGPWIILGCIHILLFFTIHIYERLYPLLFELVMFIFDALFIWAIIEKLKQSFQPKWYFKMSIIWSICIGVDIFFNLKKWKHDPFTINDYTVMQIFLLLWIFMIVAIRFYLHVKEQRAIILKKAIETQRSLSEQVIQALETDRKRIAEDLHDDLGGNLAAIKMMVQSFITDVPKLIEISTVLDSTSASVRNISHNLMPPAFEKTNMQEILSAYFNSINRNEKIKFYFVFKGNSRAFSKTEELIIYRLIMEITNNIIKHSLSSEASIQLIYYNDYLEIMSEDNGIGMQNIDTSGIGLKSIRSRIAYFGGRLDADANEFGTTMIIKLPFKK